MTDTANDNAIAAAVDHAVNRVVRYAPHLRDDLRSEATVAYLEHAGDDPIPAMVRQCRRFVRENRDIQGDGPRVGSFRVVGKPVGMAVPKTITPTQRKKLRRNIVIQAARKQGCSLNLLAEVFDLPKSRIAAIVNTDLAREFR